jgi:excisionase family DNA binding protein
MLQVPRPRLSADQPLESDPDVTVAEIARACRITKLTVYRAVRNGELEALRPGKSYLIRMSEARKWMQERAMKANSG